MAWVVLNSIMLPMFLADKEGFDPYPYILLNLFVDARGDSGSDHHDVPESSGRA